jgi:hypothetical protein
MSFEERSNALVELLEKLEENDHEYVLIGGYAVSAFNPRFSTDLDVVISPRDENEFRDFLDDEGFELEKKHRKDWFYDREVKEYKKYLEPGLPIGFDLLVNGLGCRQTEAEWSFRHLRKYSTKKEVMAGTLKTIARVVDPEVLIAAKLHSGRETDLRDVTALVDNVELEDVTQHLRRGDEDTLREQLENGLEILEGEDLKQGYKSDFGESAVPEESVEKLRRYLREQIETLS